MIQAAPGAAPQAGEAIRGLKLGEPRSRSGQPEIWVVAENGSISRQAAKSRVVDAQADLGREDDRDGLPRGVFGPLIRVCVAPG